MTLLLKNELNASHSDCEPTHLTTPQDRPSQDLGECGYAGMAGAHTGGAQIPGTARHWPQSLSRLVPRTLSDYVPIIGRRPADGLGPVVDRWGD